MSPTPTKSKSKPETGAVPSKAPETLSFLEALDYCINKDVLITRLEWNNPDEYCFATDYLMIHTKGADHQWIIRDGDWLANDWVELTE